jgi:GMP synthase (glutamine-hydrolysing)
MSERSRQAPILVLQHIRCEPPAAYEDELDARGIALHRVRVDEGEDLPDWRAYSGIVAMGGPMGTYEDDVHPWLTREKQLIADAARAGAPFWGVCLGAQLLAASLDASVAPGPLPEVGVLPVTLTAAGARDPVFAAAPQRFASFHWHGDTYELPAGAVQLARSAQYEQQAFVFERAYALQFHLEVTATLVAEWAQVPAYADSLSRLPDAAGVPGILEQVAAAQAGAIALARSLFGRWLELVAGIGAATAV